MKPTGPSNIHLQTLIADLKKQAHQNSVSIWKRIAEDLEKPTRQRRVVNVNRLNRVTKANDLVIVPGKVLGTGNLSHNLTIAAWSFSQSAKEEIEKAKGKCLSISELVKQNPKGQKVRIIG